MMTIIIEIAMVYLGIGLLMGTCLTINVLIRKKSGKETLLDDGVNISEYMFYAILIWPCFFVGCIKAILDEMKED